MGRNKNKKNKAKQATEETSPPKQEEEDDDFSKELSEADAAAGAMVKKKPPKRALEQDEEQQSQENGSGTVKKPNEKDKEKSTHSMADPPVKLTRKQKRQKLNEKNKWPQQPKITNPEARAKAYLRVAGIEAVKDNEDDDQNIDKMMEPPEEKMKTDDESDTEWRRFGRFLGAADTRTRHKAVKRLGQYLRAKSGFGWKDASEAVGLSELDLLKLWKGLWFTLYMADKVPVQDELAKHIAKLMWCLAGPLEEDEMAGQAYLDMEMEEQMALEEAAASQQDDEEGSQSSDSDDGENDEDETPAITWKRNNKGKQSKDQKDQPMEEDSEEEDESMEEMEDDEEGAAEMDENHKHIRGAPLAQLMVRTFFRTLVREWGNMDKYRVDKFYTLVRYILDEVYKYMASRQWNIGIIKLFNDAIAEEALMKQPNGVRFHLIDIALEELQKVACGTSGKSGKDKYLPVTESIFLEVMEPYFCVATHGFGDRGVQARAVEKILEKFLLEFSLVSDSNNTDDDNDNPQDENNNILDQVHVGTVSKFIFELASDKSTPDCNRKSLYDVHKTYERQRKKMGTDLELKFETQMESAADYDQEDEDEEDADYSEDQGTEEVDDDLQYLGFVPESDDDDDDGEEKPQQPAKSKGEKPTESTTKKDKKNKKKRKKKGNKKDSDAQDLPEGKPDDSAEEVPEKSEDSKPKDETDATNEGGDDAIEPSKRKQKKKKDKKKKRDKAKGDESTEKEEVVTISLSEQKHAKQALKISREEPTEESNKEEGTTKKKQKKKKKESKETTSIELDDDDDDDEGTGERRRPPKRRVSFDKFNQARSWKASMRGLRTMDPSEAASKTPEKSILLNKGKKSPINKDSNTKRRKRATDYF